MDDTSRIGSALYLVGIVLVICWATWLWGVAGLLLACAVVAFVLGTVFGLAEAGRKADLRRRGHDA